LKKRSHGVIETKFSTNVDGKVEDLYPFVAKYSYRDDSKEGFVSTVNSFHSHFNHVQFGKSILDNYQKKVEELEKLVDIHYYNVDAFIIDEFDFHNLQEEGYIGDCIGQFKIEAIFTEVCFKSPRSWMGLCGDGSVFCRPRKLIEKTSFEEFKNNVLNSSSQS
jgi:hypothetical protein